MPNAKFIKFIDNNNNTCSICSDEIAENKGISLSCNPSKHIFCYDCIFDWYYQLKTKPNVSNYNMARMCPVCRNDGGYLPIIEGFNYIRGIHYNKVSIPICFEVKKCGYKLKNNNELCSKKGQEKYGGLCLVHHNCSKKNSVIDVNTENMINNIINETITNVSALTNINANNGICGAKLKTKNGFCQVKCIIGHCGRHKS